MEKTGYCDCSELSELYKSKQKAEALEKECERFIEKKYPSEDYRKIYSGFLDAVIKYSAKLTSFVGSGKLNLRNSGGIIDASELTELLKGRHEITIHCAKCGQKIDTAEDKAGGIK